MKIFLTKVYLFLEIFAYPFSANLRKRKKDRKKITNELIEDYNGLIKEAKLIELKQSKLTRKERYKLMETVDFLIEKGHIKRS
jgi:hypothetical protein